MTKGNSGETAVNCTQRQEETLNGLDRIREAAKRDKTLRFTSLMHHITVDMLRDAYLALKRDAAPVKSGTGSNLCKSGTGPNWH